MKITTSMRLIPLPFISAFLCLLVVPVAQAIDSTSTSLGGAFNAPTTWQVGGVPVSGASNSFAVQSGAIVTTSSDFASANISIARMLGGTLTVQSGGSVRYNGAVGLDNQSTLNFIAGASTVNIESGGYVHSPRISFAASTSATFNISGSLNVSAGGLAYGVGSSATYNISTGGVYRIAASSLGGAGTSVYNVSGGTLLFALPAGSSALSANATTWNISSGKVDYSGYAYSWGNPTGNFNWTGGTMANVYNITQATMRNVVVGDFGASANTILDINTGNTAHTWDLTSVGMTKTLGTFQFDIFSTTSSDSITSTGVWSLTSGVKIDLGYAGGLISDVNDYIGQSFTLFNGLTNFTNMNAQVLAATWFDGTNTYDVTFTSNLNTNGSVTIASMAAVPEPSTMALAALGLGFAFFRTLKLGRSSRRVA